MRQLLFCGLLVLAFASPHLLAENSQEITLHLKNGSSISGKLVSEDKKSVVVNWQGGEISFGRNEIASIQNGNATDSKDGITLAQAEDPSLKWPYKNNPVIKLTNTQIMDAKVKEIRGDIVVLSQDLGDGAMVEHDIPRNKIESLEFRRIKNADSDKVEDFLRKQFPKMRFHRMGMVTLVTDSEGAALKILKQVIVDQTSIFYFEFLDLVKNKQPQMQHYVVVFDNLSDYFEYAITDGVPAWLCPGYFNPSEKVLFMMNYFGNQFTNTIYQVVTGGRAVIDSQSKALNRMTGGQYEIQLEGVSREANMKLESAMNYLSGIFTDQSLVTLRHEITHEFFHDWGLQTIIASKMKEKDEALIKKKRDLLDTKDVEKKKELLLEILSAKKKDSIQAPLNIEASNSWFVEGLAEYASTSAIGQKNTERLYEIKETKRRGELWPIEQLTVYKMGSFPGVTTKAVLSAYAQSWSFVDFLMKNYRQGFMKYLERMSQQTPSKDEDFQWLIQSLGVDAKTLQTQWASYIDSLETIEDPQIDQWIRLREILK